MLARCEVNPPSCSMLLLSHSVRTPLNGPWLVEAHDRSDQLQLGYAVRFQAQKAMQLEPGLRCIQARRFF